MWKKMERWCQLAVILMALAAVAITVSSRITALEVKVDYANERLTRIEAALFVPTKVAERR